MERKGDRWLVNGDIETPLVVGAGGHFCPVARRLRGEEDELRSVVAAQEIEFEASAQDLARCAVRAEVPELYFCKDLQGYGWCFRKGNFLNIGLGRLDADKLSVHVAAFLEFLRGRNIVACDVPDRFHGHAYRLYEGREPRFCDDAVLLIGDAAGLAYPQSGEGIRPAVESGLAAAQTIRAAAGNYSRERLAAYGEAVVQNLGAPRRRGAADWLPASWLQFVAGRLLSSHWFSRRVVLDRWFLHSA
jgi:flavin-dependent dehydrogenase